MPGPFDYTTQINPAANLLAGIGQGLNIASTRANREQREIENALAIRNAQLAQQKFQAQQQEQEQYQNALQTRILNNPNPTDRDYLEVMSMAPAAQQDALKASWDRRDANDKANRLRSYGEIFALTVNGKTDAAIERLNTLSTSARETGNEADAKITSDLASILKESPETGSKLLGITLSSLPGGDKIVENAFRMEKKETGPLPAASIQEYNAAKEGGFTGNFLEFKRQLQEAINSAPNTPPANRQKSEGYLLKKPDGGIVVATPVFDPNTGTTQINETPLTGQVVSSTGETPAERQAREVETAGQKTGATETEKRAQGIITAGLEAADSTADIRRAIQLLDNVKTSGIRNIALSAKKFFGVEGTDEAELSNKLGKAVLAQLRPIFGAQFTAREGQELKGIEAGFGNNAETNKRLLNQALQIARRAAKRGIAAAKSRQDSESAQYIQDALDFELAPYAPEQATTAPAASATAGGPTFKGWK